MRLQPSNAPTQPLLGSQSRLACTTPAGDAAAPPATAWISLQPHNYGSNSHCLDPMSRANPATAWIPCHARLRRHCAVMPPLPRSNLASHAVRLDPTVAGIPAPRLPRSHAPPLPPPPRRISPDDRLETHMRNRRSHSDRTASRPNRSQNRSPNRSQNRSQSGSQSSSQRSSQRCCQSKVWGYGSLKSR